MPHHSRLLPIIAVAALGTAAGATPALASSNQEAIFQDGPTLRAQPARTLRALEHLGAERLRLLVFWNTIAPGAGSHHKPKHFKASDPGSYPAANWSIYDTIVRAAQADGIQVDLTLTGPAPLWATGSGAPGGGPYGQWKPSAPEYGAFVQAIGTRYSGSYKPRRSSTPLPRVGFWAIWNEPNYGIDLAPQATNGDTVEVGAAAYRGLLDHAWGALHASGHGNDTILIGETAPHGHDHPIGMFNGVKPLRFLRALYCVDSSFRPLRGSAASTRGCPTTAAGSAGFRGQHPGLFQASGFAAHLYAQGVPPNTPKFPGDADMADLPEVPHLARTLDRLTGAYGSNAHYQIWNTEYGYQTNPPERLATVSPATGAYYINWAEYLSWKQPRVSSYEQYLLVDPARGNFASGLEFSGGQRKPAYDAYRLPIYLPVTSTGRGRALEVWGCARPAHSATTVSIQFQANSHGAFKTVRTVPVSNPRGYFDVNQTFPGSGSVRLAWTYPAGGGVAYSRKVKLTVR